jgi:hypothetical protein
MNPLARDPPSLSPFGNPIPKYHRPTSHAYHKPALLLPPPLPDLSPPDGSASSLPSRQPDALRSFLHTPSPFPCFDDRWHLEPRRIEFDPLPEITGREPEPRQVEDTRPRPVKLVSFVGVGLSCERRRVGPTLTLDLASSRSHLGFWGGSLITLSVPLHRISSPYQSCLPFPSPRSD